MGSLVNELICWDYLTVHFIEHLPHEPVLCVVNVFHKFSLVPAATLQL